MTVKLRSKRPIAKPSGLCPQPKPKLPTASGWIQLRPGRWLLASGAFILLGSLIALLFSVSVWPARAFSEPAACENSFAGAVYFDQNRDGHFASNESYLPGQVEIVDHQGATQQIIESHDGSFSAQRLACNTYQIQHNRAVVGIVVIGEVMTQEVKMFPKVQTLFFPVVAQKMQ